MWPVVLACMASFGDRQGVPRWIQQGQVNTINAHTVHKSSLHAVHVPCVSSMVELIAQCDPSLQHFLRTHGVDILQIDIECLDHEVIYSSLDSLRPRVVHYEDACLGEHSARVASLLESRGYTVKPGVDGGNKVACLGQCNDFASVMESFVGKTSFIQIGANDGITNDPLRQYIAKGDFLGIMVEPTRALFTQLSGLYANRPGICMYQGAFAANGRCKDGNIVFYEY